MLELFQHFRTERHEPVRYSFYVWENGTYVQMNAGEYRNDWEATEAAQQHFNSWVLKPSASLDAPHLHVVREDGVHIITLELPEQFQSPETAGTDPFPDERLEASAAA